MVSGDNYGQVVLSNFIKGKIIRSMKHRGAIRSVQFVSNDKYILSGQCGRPMIILLCTFNGKAEKTFFHGH